MSSTTNFNVDFIGIGAARSGTSWLFECLSEHPEICTSSLKEVPFFNSDHNFKKGLRYYTSFFTQCGEDKIIGEYNPKHMLNPDAAKRIYNTFPDVKLIVSLRDPVEAIYSEYKFAKARGRHGYSDFYLFTRENKDFLERYSYFTQLHNFFSLFPRENIHIITYENIQNNPKDVMKKLYSFLGADPSYTPRSIDTKINTSRTGKNLTFMRPIFALYDSLQESTLGEQIVSLIARSPVAGYLADKLHQVNTPSKTAGETNYREEMGARARSLLEDYYRGELEELKSATGITFPRQ